MKVFGSISRLVSILFRKDGQDITTRPNQSTTYSAARDIQLPPGDTDHVLVSASSTQTLTGKTIDGDDNTVQDLALSSLKTVLADADKVIRRDASGAVISGNSIPNSSALVTTDSTSTFTNKTFDADGTGNVLSNIDDGNIKAGAAIDASKIADGSVSNTEFQYINSLTSNAQTQIDGKASRALDNLASVAINTSLVSDTDNTDDLGSAAIAWKEGFINKVSLDSNSQTTSIQGSASASASVSYSLPPAAPASNGYVLASTTGGVMSWVSNASISSYKADWTDVTHTDAAASFFDATANTILSTAHGLVNGQALYFTTDGSLPAEITSGQIYYVVNKNNDDFQVAATYGGSAIDISSVGSGNHTYSVTSYAAVHGLGSQDLMCQVFDKDDGFQVEFNEVIRVSTTHVIFNGTELPGGTGFRVLIMAV